MPGAAWPASHHARLRCRAEAAGAACHAGPRLAGRAPERSGRRLRTGTLAAQPVRPSRHHHAHRRGRHDRPSCRPGIRRGRLYRETLRAARTGCPRQGPAPPRRRCRAAAATPDRDPSRHRDARPAAPSAAACRRHGISPRRQRVRPAEVCSWKTPTGRWRATGCWRPSPIATRTRSTARSTTVSCGCAERWNATRPSPRPSAACVASATCSFHQAIDRSPPWPGLWHLGAGGRISRLPIGSR